MIRICLNAEMVLLGEMRPLRVTKNDQMSETIVFVLQWITPLPTGSGTSFFAQNKFENEYLFLQSCFFFAEQ